MDDGYKNRNNEIKRAITLILEAKCDGLSQVHPFKKDSFFIRRIVELSKKYNADISKDEMLLRHVSRLEALEVINEDLFPTVAEILAGIYKLSQNKRAS